jgi:hypothetical protein
VDVVVDVLEGERFWFLFAPVRPETAAMSMFTRTSTALPLFGTRQSGVFPIARFAAKGYIVLTFEMIMVFKRNDSWNRRQAASIMVCPALSSGLAISEGANR